MLGVRQEAEQVFLQRRAFEHAAERRGADVAGAAKREWKVSDVGEAQTAGYDFPIEQTVGRFFGGVLIVEIGETNQDCGVAVRARVDIAQEVIPVSSVAALDSRVTEGELSACQGFGDTRTERQPTAVAHKQDLLAAVAGARALIAD